MPDFVLPGNFPSFSTFINVKKRAHKHNSHEQRQREALLLLRFVSRGKSVPDFDLPGNFLLKQA